ncbi:major facilitator superfamily MFS_1 [Beutenbergia cavernae DSM 12333]|uniref:Major facilitator superfamily MFS_1 n=1 Tax=Beutenbergia cavernae (strain ATCC BAA-8 / DSM 12333 / CCUG 43141 / JCM 11478 / NBRC 16432 / NCIMB 13614 / HKI 0122) TaxID=471853 RepID=C5C225_BEUC1|nr:MFS transporter [Beutenbergia cavernae]ACQ81650.1 major facilitator superfamily MFS_1 [Beutenbergia cavernae DSM 12333]
MPVATTADGAAPASMRPGAVVVGRRPAGRAAGRGAAPAAPRPWAALAVLVLPVLAVSLDGALLTFALPQLSRDLAPSAAQLVWITDAYPMVLAALLVPMGAVGDRIGRRRLLVLGCAGFAVVTLAAATASDPVHLIVARALLGVCGATLMPASLALLRATFPDAGRRRAAVAAWAATFAVGAGAAPFVGAAVLDVAGGGAVRALAAPLALGVVLAAPRLVAESRSERPGALDGWSVVCVVVALAALVHGATSLAAGGPDGVATVAVALGAGALFVRRQLRLPRPLLDLRLLRCPALGASVGVNLLSQAAFVGLALWTSQYLQLVLGLTPAEAARGLVAGPAGAVVAGLLVVPLARRLPLRVLLPGALLVSGAGYALTTAGVASAASVAVILACVGFGAGLAEALTGDAVLGAVPPSRAGAAASMAETAFELGAALGVAVLGSVLAACYRARLVVPGALPAGDADAAARTLGGASGVAHRNPELGDELMVSAREAFASGVQATSAVCLVLTLVAAVGAGVMLRRR